MSAHTCSKCGHQFPLSDLPDPIQRIFLSTRTHIPFSEYVYAVCPKCGQKDWAEERRFLGVLGPRGFYALAFLLAVFIVVAVYYLGFVGL